MSLNVVYSANPCHTGRQWRRGLSLISNDVKSPDLSEARRRCNNFPSRLIRSRAASGRSWAKVSRRRRRTWTGLAANSQQRHQRVLTTSESISTSARNAITWRTGLSPSSSLITSLHVDNAAAANLETVRAIDGHFTTEPKQRSTASCRMCPMFDRIEKRCIFTQARRTIAGPVYNLMQRYPSVASVPGTTRHAMLFQRSSPKHPIKFTCFTRHAACEIIWSVVCTLRNNSMSRIRQYQYR